MPRVQVLSRTSVTGLTEPGLTTPAVAVTYATERLAPRVVNVPAELYREASDEELASDRSYRFVPKDDESAAAEQAAIAADIERAQARRVDSYELP